MGRNMNKLFIFLLTLLFAQPGFADVAYVSPHSSAGTGGTATTSISTNVTVPAGSNLYAVISLFTAASDFISTCTLAGISCNLLNGYDYTASVAHEVFGVKLGSDSAGTQALYLEWPTNAIVLAYIQYFSGVDQTTPTTGLDLNSTFSGNTCSIAISGSGTTGMVVSSGLSNLSSPHDLTATTGTQDAVANDYASSSRDLGIAHLAGSAGAVTASWSATGTGCSVYGVAILPATGGTPSSNVLHRLIQ